MTPAEFEAWLKGAAPGASLIYHQGFLAADRGDAVSGYLASPIEPTNSLATAVLHAADAGFVFIVQRRIGHGRFQYIAVKSADSASTKAA
jgi:hypothetical protein